MELELVGHEELLLEVDDDELELVELDEDDELELDDWLLLDEDELRLELELELEFELDDDELELVELDDDELELVELEDDELELVELDEDELDLVELDEEDEDDEIEVEELELELVELDEEELELVELDEEDELELSCLYLVLQRNYDISWNALGFSDDDELFRRNENFRRGVCRLQGGDRVGAPERAVPGRLRVPPVPLGDNAAAVPGYRGSRLPPGPFILSCPTARS